MGQTPSVPIQATEQSASIYGVVINAVTNKPLARALVEVEGHAVLTASDGKFGFAGLSDTTATLRVRKPGFYGGPDLSQVATKPVTVGLQDIVEVRLYPEALITGTIKATNGDPLAQVAVQALRSMSDGSGSRWIMAAQTSTNADGQFRLPLPGGEYVVETQYRPGRFGGQDAILPLLVPAGGSSTATGNSSANGAAMMRVPSGSEQHLDLHPPMRPSHAVHIQIDSTGSPAGGQFAPPIQVHLANGLVFSPASRRSEIPGETVLSLPNGSYLLSAQTGVGGDAASYGETRVTVADEDVSGVTIHLQKALQLSIEVSLAPSANATSAAGGSAGTVDPGSASFVQQLGISLQRTNAGVSLRNENVSRSPRRGAAAEFTLLPGTYRLRATGASPWFIESASAGGTDLLTQDLVVDGGSSSLPLRLVVNNQTAAIKGTTRLGAQATSCVVYLISNAPSATPVIEAMGRSDGSFLRSQIPPGTYQVIASETRLPSDLTNTAVQRELAAYMKTITVGAGETATLDLDAMPASELKP